MPRYAAAVVGAVVVYGIEQLLTDDFARCAVADFAWTAAAIGAIFGTARAVRASRGDDRMVWLLFCAGSVSWLVGQLLRDAAEIGGLPMPSPLVADLGFMTAAPVWTIALVLLLRRHGQKLTLYALILDVGAVVLTLVAAVTLFLATTLATDVGRDPQASAVAVLYPLLYVAATRARDASSRSARPCRSEGTWTFDSHTRPTSNPINRSICFPGWTAISPRSTWTRGTSSRGTSYS